MTELVKTKTHDSEAEEAEIEFETVTLKVPKKIMDFMRSLPNEYPPNPVEWLEYSIVDHVRADLEAVTGEEIISWFGLDPVFRKVLGDKRF